MLKRIAIGGGVVLALLLLAAAFVYKRPLTVVDQQIRFRLWRAGAKSRYVDVAGQQIHYFEVRPPTGSDGIPLVLIHGLGDRGEAWAPLIPGLAAAGFHVFVPDLLGYGRSARPDVSYSIGLEEKVIVDFMHAVHVDRASVSGWSMGGWIAMKLGADHPEMVDRLLLFDAAGLYFSESSRLGEIFDAKDADGVRRLLATLTPNPRAIPDFIAQDLARRIQGNVWVVKRSMAAMTSGRDLMEFRLGSIRQPTLVVWGRQDAVIPLSSGERLHKGIAGSSMLIVDGCGHLTPSECSRVSLQAAVAFLEAQPPLTGVERVVEGSQ